MNWLRRLFGIQLGQETEEEAADGSVPNLELHVTVDRLNRKADERRQRLLDLRAQVLTRETTQEG